MHAGVRGCERAALTQSCATCSPAPVVLGVGWLGVRSKQKSDSSESESDPFPNQLDFELNFYARTGSPGSLGGKNRHPVGVFRSIRVIIYFAMGNVLA